MAKKIDFEISTDLYILRLQNSKRVILNKCSMPSEGELQLVTEQQTYTEFGMGYLTIFF